MRRVRETFSFWSILGLLLFPELGWGQAPTIETTQISGAATLTPGSTQSRLGPMPGAGAMILGTQPGRDELLLNRIGTATPRVPAAITTPGQAGQVQRPLGITAPAAFTCPSIAALRNPGSADRGGERGTGRWPDARPGHRAADQEQLRPAVQVHGNPPGARRYLDGQPAPIRSSTRIPSLCPTARSRTGNRAAQPSMT